MRLYARQIRRVADYSAGKILGSAFVCRQADEGLSFHLVDGDDVDLWLNCYLSHPWLSNGQVGVSFVSEEEILAAGLKIEFQPNTDDSDPFKDSHYEIPCESLADLHEKLADGATKHAGDGRFRPLLRANGTAKKELSDP